MTSERDAWVERFCDHYGVKLEELTPQLFQYIDAFPWDKPAVRNSAEEVQVFGSGTYGPLKTNRPRARFIVGYLARKKRGKIRIPIPQCDMPKNLFADYRSTPPDEWPPEMKFLLDLIGVPEKFRPVQPDHVVVDTTCNSGHG